MAHQSPYLDLTCRPYACQVILAPKLPTTGGGPSPRRGFGPDAAQKMVAFKSAYVPVHTMGRASPDSVVTSGPYLAMETLVVTGSGFAPRENITLSLYTPWNNLNVQTTADAAGVFAHKGAVTFSTRALLRPRLCCHGLYFSQDYSLIAQGRTRGDLDALGVVLLRPTR